LVKAGKCTYSEWYGIVGYTKSNSPLLHLMQGAGIANWTSPHDLSRWMLFPVQWRRVDKKSAVSAYAEREGTDDFSLKYGSCPMAGRAGMQEGNALESLLCIRRGMDGNDDGM
jgi:hypothetical protein